MPTTEAPASRSRSLRWLPKKPAQPVTRARLNRSPVAGAWLEVFIASSLIRRMDRGLGMGPSIPSSISGRHLSPPLDWPRGSGDGDRARMLEKSFQCEPVVGERGPTEAGAVAELGTQAAFNAAALEAGVVHHRDDLGAALFGLEQRDMVGDTEGLERRRGYRALDPRSMNPEQVGRFVAPPAPLEVALDQGERRRIGARGAHRHQRRQQASGKHKRP